MPTFKKNSSPFMMKNSALKGGAKGSPIQGNYSKPSPAKWIPAVIAAIKGLSAKTLVTAAAAGAASAAGGKAVSGGKKNNPTEIISGEQTKIMQDDKENV